MTETLFFKLFFPADGRLCETVLCKGKGQTMTCLCRHRREAEV